MSVVVSLSVSLTTRHSRLSRCARGRKPVSRRSPGLSITCRAGGRMPQSTSERLGFVPNELATAQSLAGTISYDEESKIFRLYGKQSMYCFRVDERGSLEHLHWGGPLDPKDDLRYLTYSNQALPFDPGPGVFFENMAPLQDLLGAGQEVFQDPNVLRGEWETARLVQSNLAAVEENPLSGPLQLEAAEVAAFEARRRENATWRLMKMQELQARRAAEGSDGGESFDEGLGIETDDDDVFEDGEDSDLEEASPSTAPSQSASGASGGKPKRRSGIANLSPSLKPGGMKDMMGQRVTSVASLLALDDDLDRPALTGWGPSAGAASHPSLGDVPAPQASSVVTTLPAALAGSQQSIGAGAGTALTGTMTPDFQGTPPAGSTSWMLQMGSAALSKSFAGMDMMARAPSSTYLQDFQAPEVGRNSMLHEYAEGGTGDFRPPSFTVEYQDGSDLSPVVYFGHKISKGKHKMAAAQGKLPETSGGPDDCMSLIVTLKDTVTGLMIDLVYTVYKDVDAIVRRVQFRNLSRNEIRLTKLYSCTVDFHSEVFHLVQLSGSWANERHIVERKLDYGKSSVESTRGTSSHQHNPFAAVTVGPPAEDHGDVYAFNLVYSGNFRIEADVTESERLRINVGINPDKFEWHLPSGDSFESPECVMVWSGTGMTNMSHQYHRMYRKYLMPQRFVHEVSPILINTWEAMYFGVTHERVMELASAAAACGCEMLVLDDGWFGERNDATSSLGDWFADLSKLPKGLPGLVQDVNALGLKFGLWIEPEMINIKSKLYQAHPDWCLHQIGRPHSEGRNQLVLDMGRTEVREYIYNVIAANLSCANIEYVKWDMNRHLTEVYGNGIRPQKQGEVYHRYMVGVYKLALALAEGFPHIRFEMCSGGGGRFDPGMLYYAPQIWTSDNTDAISRMKIQTGTSLCYPLSCMGSHISAVPNHQTNRLTTFKTRFLVALFGSFGLELDVAHLNFSEVAEVKSYIQLHHELSPIVLEGDFYRIWSPFKSDATAWACVDTELDRAVVVAFLNVYDPGVFLPRLRLKGLKRGVVYEVEELIPNTAVRNPNTAALEVHPGGAPQWQLGRRVIEVSGSTLMDVGLPVKLSFDGDSVAFVLHKKGTKPVRGGETQPGTPASTAPSTRRTTVNSESDGPPGPPGV